jgi:hypothetical protein
VNVFSHEALHLGFLTLSRFLLWMLLLTFGLFRLQRIGYMRRLSGIAEKMSNFSLTLREGGGGKRT